MTDIKHLRIYEAKADLTIEEQFEEARERVYDKIDADCLTQRWLFHLKYFGIVMFDTPYYF